MLINVHHKGNRDEKDRPLNLQKLGPSLFKKINIRKLVIDKNAPDKITRWAFSSEQDGS